MLPVAAKKAAGFLATRCDALARSGIMAAQMRLGSGSGQPEPAELRLSEELLSRVEDKELLHSCGFIGGKWVQATDRSTYQVLLLRWFKPGTPPPYTGLRGAHAVHVPSAASARIPDSRLQASSHNYLPV
jgi:hypothetical protein